MESNEFTPRGRTISVTLDVNCNARLRQLTEYYNLSDAEAIRFAIDEKWQAMVMQKAEASLHEDTSDD